MHHVPAKPAFALEIVSASIMKSEVVQFLHRDSIELIDERRNRLIINP
jgi:hypothetical protein